MPRPDAALAGATWALEAIGTRWEITVDRPLADVTRAAVLRCIEDVDRTWSRFRADSVVSRAARDGGSWILSEADGRLLELYDALHALTGGAVTPLVARALSDLGYDADYSLRPSADPSAAPLWDLVRWESPVLTLREPVLLDVGAAGKGMLVDLVSAVLADAGHRYLTVDASGDLVHRGEWPLRVALEDPRDARKAVGIVEVPPGRALCASAVNRRVWGEGLHHVLDGRTGEPTDDVVATWVLAEEAMLADGLATALFFASPEAVTERWDVQWALMHRDGRFRWSRDLPAEVFR
ncbi:FAD:protein FMN transferase [Aeromicrobium sp. CF4.19]|uniref:FAD:protein FMN transferase n=1 Tax=Aeromicrobium sp. CF4.19 TaxID=3373082 RepID=UPI003EE78E08